MSLYALIGLDREDSLPARLRVREAHLERVRALADAGRIVVAGPFPAIDCDIPGEAGFTGSLIVAEFDDLEAARRWFEDDPYVTNGVFQSHEVRPFIQVLP
jgi:uncharacterized protein YciI